MLKRSKYLVTNRRDKRWGLMVETVGYEEIMPGDDYPTTGHWRLLFLMCKKEEYWANTRCSTPLKGGTFRSEHVKQPVPLKRGVISHCCFPANGILIVQPAYRLEKLLDRIQKDRIWMYSLKRISFSWKTCLPCQLLRKNWYNFIIRHKAAVEEAAYTQQLLLGIVNHMMGLMYSLEKEYQLNKRTAVM